MDVRLMEIGVSIKEIMLCTSRWCYRSVCKHPFLVGFFCFLICLHRSFPFVFSLLVSASPVLVCTAVLLGTLLSFGQPNIPEIEIEEKRTSHEGGVLFKTGVLHDAVSAGEKNESGFVERFGLEMRDEVEHSSDRVNVLEGRVQEDAGSDDTVPLIGERERSPKVELDQVDLLEGEVCGEVVSNDIDPLIREGERLQEVVLNQVDLVEGEVCGGVVSNDVDPLIREGEQLREVVLNHVDLLEGEVCGGVVSDDIVPLIGKGEQSREVELNQANLLDGSNYIVPLIVGREGLREDQLNDDEGWEAKRGLSYDEEGEWNAERHSEGEVVENHYAPIPVVDDGRSSSDDERSEVDSFGSEKVNVDTLDSPPCSPWTRVVSREEEVERKGDGECNDDVDSGSDRAESSSPDASLADILPMLDELHPLLDREAPCLAHMLHDDSDAASRTSTGSHGSDDEAEAENHRHLDAVDDEDTHGDKEEKAQSAITWTEEDQKNLMDLGSSEIERNLRLESLILRRRARANASMLPERDLIDLESLDFPFSVTPISTKRQNPFDHPPDTQDLGLPPIPGSAPSVLLHRRNPFDIPYDSSEEKPNLSGDGFQEEFMVSRPREVFRRHESFNVRPSLFAQESNDVKMRPFFVPERTISEESSYSHFQRQLREISESKVSSVLETESSSSVEDMKNRTVSEDDYPQQVEVIQPMKEANEKCSKENVHRKQEMSSIVESVSEHVGHGCDSLEEERSSELGQPKKSGFEDELKFHSNDAVYHYEGESVNRAVEVEATGYHQNSVGSGQRYRSSSSSSSLSEESERVFTEMESVVMSMQEQRQERVGEEPSITTQTSIEIGELSSRSALVLNIPHRVPVYDSSPREVGMNLTSASLTSVVHPDADPGVHPVLVKGTVSFAERESGGHSLETESNIPSSTEVVLPKSLVSDPLDETRQIINEAKHKNVGNSLSGIDHTSVNEGSLAAESFHEASTEETIMEKHNLGEVCSPSTDSIHSVDDFSADKNLDQPQEDKHLLISEIDDLSDISESASKGDLKMKHSVGSEGENVVESQVVDADVNSEAEEKSVSVLDEGNTTIIHDKAIQEVISEQLNEAPELCTPEIREIDCDISSNTELPLNHDYASFKSIAFEAASSSADLETIVEEVDEIKEIDEGLLSELDNVGDFGVNRWGSSSIKFEKHKESSGGSLASAQHSEISMMGAVEVNLYEESTLKDTLHSEIQSEGNENNGQDSSNQEAPKVVVLSVENESSHSIEDNVYTIPEVEVPSTEEVDFLSSEADFTSVGSKIASGDAEVPYQGQVDSRMPELEAMTIKGIDLAFKKISDEEIEKAILEPPEAELAAGEFTTQHPEYGTPCSNPVAEAAHQGQVDSEMPELEASSIEDIDLAFKKISAEEIEKAILESPEAELAAGEFTTQHPEYGTPSSNPVAEVAHQGQVDSEMPELEASTIEDIDLAFKKIGAEEIKKPVLQPPEVEFIVGETTTQHPKYGTPHLNLNPVDEVSYHGQGDSGMPELEASTIKDIALAFKKISSEEIEKPVLEPLEDLAVGETTSQHPEFGTPDMNLSVMSATHETPVEDSMDDNRLNDGSVENFKPGDTVDHVQQMVEPVEKLETSLELLKTEAIPLEGTVSHPKQALDCGELQKVKPDDVLIEVEADEVGSANTMKAKLDDGLMEVEEDKVGSSMEGSSINEASNVMTEKPGCEVEPPKDLDLSSIKSKGKISKSSSSSSSSSSELESHSSDSEKE